MLDMNNAKHRALVKEFGRVKAKQMLAGAGFAKTLHAAVCASKYTRQQLADLIGCSKPALDKWLNGYQYPAAHFLWRLCLFIHPDYDEFGKVIPNSDKQATEANRAYVQLISLER